MTESAYYLDGEPVGFDEWRAAFETRQLPRLDAAVTAIARRLMRDGERAATRRGDAADS